MGSSIYASQIESFNSALVAIAASAGGTTTIATNYFYWFSGLSRGGLNKLTSLGQVPQAIGEKVTLTFNSALPNGCDTIALILSASTTNDPATAVVLGFIPLRDSDQVTTRSLPITFELTDDEHFELNSSVATVPDLATVARVFGTQRFVTSESAYYLYDSEGWFPETNSTPDWFRINGILTDIVNTEAPRSAGQFFGGCDTPIVSLVADSVLKNPLWNGTGDNSPTQKIWFINGLTEDLGTIFPVGTGFDFIPSINERNSLGEIITSSTSTGLERTGSVTELTPVSRIRRSTGTIDAALSGSPIVFTPGNVFYRLTEALSRGFALEFEVVTRAILSSNEFLSFYIREVGENGIFDTNDWIGSVVFPEDPNNPTQSKFAWIVPNSNNIKRLSGQGRIDIAGQIGGYTFSNVSEAVVTTSLAFDTPGQLVVIDGLQNGRCRVVQSSGEKEISESIRAIASTEAGIQFASDWSNTIVVSANAQISITFNHPTAIRGDYPDEIAGNVDAVFNADLVIVELEFNGTSYFFPGTALLTSPQTILIDSLGSATTVPVIVEPSPDFGLFGYEAIAISEILSGGSLASGSYRCRFYWEFTGNSATSISHDPIDGVEVVRLPITLAQLLTNINYWRTPVLTKVALKALPIAGEVVDGVRLVQENGKLYRFVVSLSQPDDGENFLQSDDATSNQGWEAISGSGGSGDLRKVADITELKAIANNDVSDEALIHVVAVNAIYQRYNGRTNAEALPIIVRPNDYASVNAVYVRHSILDENGLSVINSDAINEGVNNLYLTAAERNQIGRIQVDFDGRNGGITGALLYLQEGAGINPRNIITESDINIANVQQLTATSSEEIGGIRRNAVDFQTWDILPDEGKDEIHCHYQQNESTPYETRHWKGDTVNLIGIPVTNLATQDLTFVGLAVERVSSTQLVFDPTFIFTPFPSQIPYKFFTETTANFLIPAFNTTIQINTSDVAPLSNQDIPIGQWVKINDYRFEVVSLDSTTLITIRNIDITAPVGVQINAGTQININEFYVVESARDFTRAETTQIVSLGVLNHPSRTQIDSVKQGLYTGHATILQIYDIVRAFGGLINAQGNEYALEVTETLSKSAGIYYGIGLNVDGTELSKKDPNNIAFPNEPVVTYTIARRTSVSPTVWSFGAFISGVWTVGATSTDLDEFTSFWDNNGTIDTIANGDWGNHGLYLLSNGNTLIVLSQYEYNNLESIEERYLIDGLDEIPPLAEEGLRRGWLGLKGNTDLSQSFLAAGEKYKGGESSGGAKGADGKNAYTETTASFTIPILNGTVQIDISNAGQFGNEWMFPGQFISIDAVAATNGRDRFTAEVVSIDSATEITIENIDPNITPGTSIPALRRIAPTGEPGLQGNPGTVTATTQLELTQLGSPPVNGDVNETWVYALNDGKLYIQPNGASQELVVSTAEVLTDGDIVIYNGSGNFSKVNLAEEILRYSIPFS